MTQQLEDTVREQLCRRLVTSEQQPDGGGDHFILFQSLSVRIGLVEIGNQVVFELLLPLADDLPHVLGELPDTLLGLLVALLGVVVVEQRQRDVR